MSLSDKDIVFTIYLTICVYIQMNGGGGGGGGDYMQQATVEKLIVLNTNYVFKFINKITVNRLNCICSYLSIYF